MIRLLVCAGMAAARLVELAHSRRNLASGEHEAAAGGGVNYLLIVAVHTLAIVGTLLGGRSKPSWFWLALLLGVQPVRAWVLLTLGDRWNTRGVVAPSLEVETGGPYRHVRHPNYAVIGVELAALPLAFGLRGLALVVSVANAVLLRSRIRDEEAALMEVPGYREHFERLPRFIPRVF